MKNLAHIDEEQGQVVLPLRPTQFHDFIRGLLGTPQSIEKSFDLNFAITLEDVQHLNLLLEQRIAQQNGAHFVELTIRFFCSDQSVVTLTGIESLNAYNEVKPIFCTCLDLTWIMLINFHGRDAPEKQEINMSFRGRGTTSNRANDEPLVRYSRRSGALHGNINFEIKHSARSWGVDMEHLLTSFVEGLNKTDSAATEYLNKYKTEITFAALSGLIALCGYGILSSARSKAAARYQELEESLRKIPQAEELKIIGKKIDFLSSWKLDGALVTDVLGALGYFSIYVVAFSVLLFWLAKLFPKKMGGYLLLTRCSIEEFQRYQKAQMQSIRNLVLAAFGSIALGMLTNYLYDKIL